MVGDFIYMETNNNYFNQIIDTPNLNITLNDLNKIKRFLTTILIRYNEIKEMYDNLINNVRNSEKRLLNINLNDIKETADRIIDKTLNVIESKRNTNLEKTKKLLFKK